MKKRLVLCMMLLLTIGLVGCGKDSQESTEPSTVTATEAAPTEAEPTEAEPTEEETDAAPTEEPIEATEEVTETEAAEVVDDELETFTSEYGYSVTYNPAMFETRNAEGVDYFEPIGQEYGEKVPTYVAIWKTEDTVDNVVAGLALQSGRDDIEMSMSTFGPESYPSTSLTYQEETEIGIQYMTFQVVDANGVVYVIEVCNGDDITQEMTGGIENILGTFVVE